MYSVLSVLCKGNEHVSVVTNVVLLLSFVNIIWVSTVRISHNGYGCLMVFMFLKPFGSFYHASKIDPVSAWFRILLIQI